MILDVFYNGFRLNDHCIINEVLPNIPKNGETQEVEVKITIKYDVQHFLDELTKILYTEGPRRLEISDRPDRYLLCEFAGPLQTTSRFRGAVATLRFVSKEKYWRSTKDAILYQSSNGVFEIDNQGTAPVPARFEFDFSQESGFISVIGPEGNITLGNLEEVDKVALPSKQTIVNLDMTKSEEVTGNWATMPPNKLLVFDVETVNRPKSSNTPLMASRFKELNIGGLTPEVDQYGYKAYGTPTAKAVDNKWNAWSRLIKFKDWTQGADDPTGALQNLYSADNYEVDVRCSLFESGSQRTYGRFIISVLDEDLKQITQTDIYKSTQSSAVTIYGTLGHESTERAVLKETWENGFSGSLRMRKQGNSFLFSWHDMKRGYGSGTSGSSIAKTYRDDYRVGDDIYIRNTATYGYHHNGTRYPIASFTRGRGYKITRIRTFEGRRQYEIAYLGTVVYWMFGEDLTYNPQGLALDGYNPQQQMTGPALRQKTVVNLDNAQRKAAYVHVIGAMWGRGAKMSHASIDGINADRLRASGSFYNVKNFFQPRDKVVIDGATGLVTVNGNPIQGNIDVDSRFFNVPVGKSQYRYVVSPWSISPLGYMAIDQRYR